MTSEPQTDRIVSCECVNRLTDHSEHGPPPAHVAVFVEQSEHLIQDLYSAGLRLHALLTAVTAASDTGGEPELIRAAIGHLDQVLHTVTSLAFARRHWYPGVRPDGGSWPR